MLTRKFCIDRAHPVVKSQLGECFKIIIYVDYPKEWPDLLQSILHNMNTQVILSVNWLLNWMSNVKSGSMHKGILYRCV